MKVVRERRHFGAMLAPPGMSAKCYTTTLSRFAARVMPV
jgi:hypothetical protein